MAEIRAKNKKRPCVRLFGRREPRGGGWMSVGVVALRFFTWVAASARPWAPRVVPGALLWSDASEWLTLTKR